jgi:alpha-maltose-1-phosphate synthase
MTTAAIFFEPDGYILSGPKLMGRQAAGNAFLRAAVAGRGEESLYAYTPQRRSAEVFGQLVREIDPKATAQWVPANRLDILSQIGTLYLPGPGLDVAARLRLRSGAAAYSLVGVTHTTASHTAMDAIIGLLSAPIMPWDALMCTSAAVAGTVKVLLESELDYLRWRFGVGIKLTLPQLPIIPLGVHCGDFVFSTEERAVARQKLGIQKDDVVALYVGRLSFHAKAHPHAMYAGLQAAAARTGKKITLVQCGWFANDAIKKSFTDGATQFCPDVRMLFTDGRDADVRRQSWAAAELFISLSDNIQETFGLTPLEAMAAGIPVVVTDWNGYKETVREGVDGFRIPTWMPPPNLGESFARDHEAGTENYDYYCGLTCQTVAVNGQVLADRLSDLVSNPSLRRQLGESGRSRAWELYDWAVVYRQYRSLWNRLAEMRRATPHDQAQIALLKAAPRSAPGRLDPYRSFEHYPTKLIAPQTQVIAASDADQGMYARLAGHGLFSYAGKALPAPNVVERFLAALVAGPMSVEELAQQEEGIDLGAAILAVSVLTKMGLVRLE